MKKIITLLMILSLQLSFATKPNVLGDEAGEWDIYKDRYGQYLGLKEVKMKLIKLRTVGPDVDIIKVVPLKEAPHLSVIHYNAGSTGTSMVVTVFRAVIYDTQKQKFIGQAPLRREYQDGKVLEAKWVFHDDLLTIEDPKEGKLEFKI